MVGLWLGVWAPSVGSSSHLVMVSMSRAESGRAGGGGMRAALVSVMYVLMRIFSAVLVALVKDSPGMKPRSAYSCLAMSKTSQRLVPHLAKLAMGPWQWKQLACMIGWTSST